MSIEENTKSIMNKKFIESKEGLLEIVVTFPGNFCFDKDVLNGKLTIEE